jgi:rSAM/selenodomain-associated transferase 2
MTKISVIIPALDEEKCIGRCLTAVRRELPGAEIVVVDGGSSDGTARVSMSHGARVISGPRGRGSQCRAGSEAAIGEWMIFLHADARLEPGCGDALNRAIDDPTFEAGTFRLDYQRPEWLYRITSWTSRFDSALTSYGDQGIVVHRELYQRVGGMPSIPLFEDVQVLDRLRRRTRIRKLTGTIVPSIRRYQANGLIKQLAFNMFLLLLYRIGVSPVRLASWYRAESHGTKLQTCAIMKLEKSSIRTGPVG